MTLQLHHQRVNSVSPPLVSQLDLFYPIECGRSNTWLQNRGFKAFKELCSSFSYLTETFPWNCHVMKSWLTLWRRQVCIAELSSQSPADSPTDQQHQLRHVWMKTPETTELQCSCQVTVPKVTPDETSGKAVQMSSTQIAASPNSEQIKQPLFQGANFEVAYYMAIDG